MKILEKLWWRVKQLFPLIYWSEYEDINGNKFISVWQQWFGRPLWGKRYKVISHQEDIFVK